MELQKLNKDRFARRKPTIDISTTVYGKVPPQAKEIEAAILGAIMLQSNAFNAASAILQPESFYVDAHQKIYKAMQSLVQKSHPIDILTTVEELKVREELDLVGDAFFVTTLTNSVVTAANIVTHCRIVYQKFLQREVIRIAGEAIGNAYEDSTDAFDLIETIESQISSLAVSKMVKPYKSLQVVADQAIKTIYATRDSGEELTGVPTGITKLDSITQGWQPTNLIVLAARPAVGKSAVAANLALNAANHPEKPTPVGIFTLETLSIQWMMRMLSAESKIDMYSLKRGQVDDSQVNRLSDIVYKKFSGTKIFFDDTSSLDIYQLKTKARIMVLKEKVGLIIIDYLQLMGGSRSFNENREQEISKISRELKQLAKELNIPIIALSQLSRAGDGTSPKLSNLRESGAIEQDADDVFFLVEITEEEVALDSSLRDSIHFKIAKHRNGIIENVPIKFVKSIQKIMNESEYHFYNPAALKGSWKPVVRDYTQPSTDDEDDLPF